MIPHLYLEVADSPESRETGLMHRHRLGRNSGMLFRFSSPTALSFWMKDTHVPLDIAFLDADRRIAEIHSLVPRSLRSVRSSAMSREAVEVNAGWFEEHGISPGCRLVTAQEEPPAPPGTESVPLAPEVAPEVAPDPVAVMNMAIRDAVPHANRLKLSIMFDYEFSKGTHETYVMEPLEPYRIEAGKHGDLLAGPCVHSDGEFRNFIIDNITGYDLFETVGEKAGRRVALSPAGTAVPLVGNAPVPARGTPVTPMGETYGRMLRESGGCGLDQMRNTRYSEEIRRRRRSGKTEGQALMECLAEGGIGILS